MGRRCCRWQFRGTLYRALTPVYVRGPMLGRGAGLYGGRFNRKRTLTLYTSMSIVTALREANQAGALLKRSGKAISARPPATIAGRLRTAAPVCVTRNQDVTGRI